MESEKRQKIAAACAVAGCRESDLLHSRISEAGVVLIIGPAGRKVIVAFEDLDLGPPPVTAEVGLPKPSFAEMVGLSNKIREALEVAGLTDPDEIREMSDRALLALPGIGRAGLKKLREIVG